MTQTPNSSSSFAFRGAVATVAATAFVLAAVANGQTRIQRPEGYLELEGDGGVSSGNGSYSVVPAPPKPPKASAPDDAAEPGQDLLWHDADSPSEDQSPPPPAPIPAPAPTPPTPRETCRPTAERFSARLAILRGNSVDAGAEPLDYAVQRAMFGRTALHTASNDIDQPAPELTWDEELKDLYRTYQGCLKAAARRAR